MIDQAVQPQSQRIHTAGDQSTCNARSVTPDRPVFQMFSAALFTLGNKTHRQCPAHRGPDPDDGGVHKAEGQHLAEKFTNQRHRTAASCSQGQRRYDDRQSDKRQFPVSGPNHQRHTQQDIYSDQNCGLTQNFNVGVFHKKHSSHG